jgi:DNA-binding NtrC family response regulator
MMRMFSFESIRGFLKVALAGSSDMQKTIVKLFREQVQRQTGSRFAIREEITPEEIRLTVESSRPEFETDYYRQHGLDPERCFRNIFNFMAGALNKSLSYLPGYDSAEAGLSVTGSKADLRLPVRSGGLFTAQTLLGAIAGYIDRVLPGGRDEPEEAAAPEGDVVMQAAVMRETWERIRRASATDETVLLRGESGTGKSFIAGKIHEISARREGPFIEVGLLADVGSENMIQSNLFGHRKGAFTGASEDKKGLFSLADGGTVFLDEIGDASPDLQAKLLKVIETSRFKPLGGLEDVEVDVRVIAATNRDLEKMVGDGTFRQDLYYRLNVIPIELPPLRERSEDIPALARFLLARTNPGGRTAGKRLSAELVADLCAYPWPGNVRELDHALRYALAMSDGPELTRADLPGALRTYLEDGASGAPAGAEAPRGGEVIDREALRRAIRSSGPLTAGKGAGAGQMPAHFEHAKRVYLETLIEEFAGDLGMIARFWDRSSEKTILKLIRDCGLESKLQEARARKSERGPAR